MVPQTSPMPCMTLKIKSNILQKQTGNQYSSWTRSEAYWFWSIHNCPCMPLHSEPAEPSGYSSEDTSYKMHYRIQLGRDWGMNNCEQTPPIQEQVHLAHNEKLQKFPHDCHLLFRQKLWVQKDLQITHTVCLGQCNPIQNDDEDDDEDHMCVYVFTHKHIQAHKNMIKIA